MGRRVQRLLLSVSALGGSVALAWVGWGALGRVRAAAPADEVAARNELAKELRLHAEGGTEETEATSWVLSEQVAHRLFRVLTVSSRSNVYDPDVWFTYRPGFTFEMPFPEHPRGRFTVRANELGLREDGPTPRAHDGLRVLVTGDSHTDGVCDNDETFAHRLEELLAARLPEARPDVLNGGHAGYSFYNYRGQLERFADFDLDVFVVAVYGGNDFLEALPVHHYFRHTLPAEFREQMSMAAGRTEGIPGGLHGQAVRQLEYFARYPEEEAVALEAAVEVSRAIVARCAELGVRPLFVYVPTQLDTQPRFLDPDPARIRELTGLDEQQMRASERLAEAWMEALVREGVEVLDLRATFRAAPERYFWESDPHVDLAAHEAIANLLADAIATRLDDGHGR